MSRAGFVSPVPIATSLRNQDVEESVVTRSDHSDSSQSTIWRCGTVHSGVNEYLVKFRAYSDAIE